MIFQFSFRYRFDIYTNSFITQHKIRSKCNSKFDTLHIFGNSFNNNFNVDDKKSEFVEIMTLECEELKKKNGNLCIEMFEST